MTIVPSLAHSSLLGSSGLRVSPLCLGTMTFGTEWGWGTTQETAFALLDAYVAAGGNFLDTADLYTQGTSERIIGAWLKARGKRDQVVLATKFTFQTVRQTERATPPNPNGGGNGRKHIVRALDASLKRLETDFVDLYWMHAYDGVTPIEEVLSTLNQLVKSGKVRAVGLSDVPAWYAARMITLAEQHGLEKPCALQLEYSLIERNIEREHVPLARALGVGITPWSPLASGLLTGKHKRGTGGSKVEGSGRVKLVENSPAPSYAKMFTDKSWSVVNALVEEAGKLGKTPAQVALNFITKRPGVQSTIIGATSVEQLNDNLTSLQFDLPADVHARLEQLTRPEPMFPYTFFDGPNKLITGGATVSAKPSWF